MKRLKASDFPGLQKVFSGYLHEDFLDEYGTPAAALRAFRDDADPAERLQFSTEARRFLERSGQVPFNEVRVLVARLGCRWTPPSRHALIALLAETTTSPANGPVT
ncbi:MAG: contact-dependent growth inhibition system immunity protein [Acidobacteriota bacterium]